MSNTPDAISHDEFMTALDEIGEAVGRALAACLSSTNPLFDDSRLALLSKAISAMGDDDRFSPHTNLVLQGIGSGIERFTKDEPPELF